IPIPLVEKLQNLNYKIIGMYTFELGQYCELYIDYADKLIPKLNLLYDDVESIGGIYRIICESISKWDVRELKELNCRIINVLEHPESKLAMWVSKNES
ncbi:MAG: hypothetical protein OXC46_03375, partial [Thaumarchaeota archaeon]|nr:hypothetical protein [Nitrososphaerota archaeon]